MMAEKMAIVRYPVAAVVMLLASTVMRGDGCDVVGGGEVISVEGDAMVLALVPMHRGEACDVVSINK